MTVQLTADKLLNEIRITLAEHGIDGARTEARIIVEHALAVDYASILSGTVDPINVEQVACARKIALQRITRTPLAYCIGSWDFYSLNFEIEPGVLVPRQDTETLVDTALEILRENKLTKPDILDLYSGVGVILIAIAANYKLNSGLGIEIDPVAHGLSIKNSHKHSLEYLKFRNNDVKIELPKLINEGKFFDIVTGNPPYVASSVISTLSPEVSCYENPVTLDGGVDGLDHFHFLAENAGGILKEEGCLLLEGGAGQDKDIKKIFKNWRSADFRRDLNGIPRVLVVRK